MGKHTKRQTEDPLEKARAFIIEQIKKGADKDMIRAKFEEMGVPRDQSHELVDTLYPAIIQAAKKQEFATDALPPAIVGAVIAAVLGGGIWGAIEIFTGYEVGYVAWGVGLLSGAAVVLFAKGRRGEPLQFIAVVSSMAGIVIGKYVAFHHVLAQAVTNRYGADAAAQVSILSENTIHFFIGHISSMFGGFDILWVVLAVITAWRIPRGMGIKVPVHVPV